MNWDNSTARAWQDDGIGQKIAAWINSYPDLPPDLYKGSITYDYLPTDKKAITLEPVQGNYISDPDIVGGYEASYRFKLVYRLKPGDSSYNRISADSLLDDMGKWTMEQKPDIGGGFIVNKIYPTTLSAKIASYNNGDEDHQIFIMVEYSVPAQV